jgi:hypothetical protein
MKTYLRFVDTVNESVTDTMLCFPLRVTKGGALMGVIRVLNKINDEFNVTDESLMQAIIMKSSAELEDIYTELVVLNHNISSFATPVLPTDGAPKAGKSRSKAVATKKRRSGGTGISANSSSALNTMGIQRSKSQSGGLRSDAKRSDLSRTKSVGSCITDEEDNDDMCIVLPSLGADDDELQLCRDSLDESSGVKEADKWADVSFIDRSVSLDSGFNARRSLTQARHGDTALPNSVSPIKKSSSFLSRLFIAESAKDDSNDSGSHVLNKTAGQPEPASTTPSSAHKTETATSTSTSRFKLPQSFQRMREKKRSDASARSNASVGRLPPTG